MINIQLQFNDETKNEVLNIAKDLEKLGFKVDIYLSGTVFAKTTSTKMLSIFMRDWWTKEFNLIIFEKEDPTNRIYNINERFINTVYDLWHTRIYRHY